MNQPFSLEDIYSSFLQWGDPSYPAENKLTTTASGCVEQNLAKI